MKKKPSVVILNATEAAELDRAAKWVPVFDISPEQVRQYEWDRATPERRQEIAWNRAWHWVLRAVDDPMVQESHEAMKLLHLLDVLFRDAEPGDWLDDFIRITKHEYLARLGKAGGRKGAEAQAKLEAKNLELVREAFEKLPAALRGRGATGIICTKTKLTSGTVLKHLKTVRAEMKAQ